MKTINVTIQGTSPLLMHAFPLEPIEALEKMPPAEQAEHGAYRDPDTGRLFIPGVNVQRALVSAAAYSKGKGRASLQKPVAAGIMVTPQRIDLGIADYEVDSRPVVVPATKGRIIRHRPRLDTWGATFTVEYDNRLLSEAQVRTIVDDCGQRVGLLDFRPECKGPFGRFMVTVWDAV